MKRTSILLVGSCLLGALALVDVSTPWARTPMGALPPCIAAGVALLVLGKSRPRRRALWLALAGLLVAYFSIHLAYSVRISYEARNWKDLAPRKSERALAKALSTFNGYVADISRAAGRAAKRDDLRSSLAAGNRAEVFACLADVAHSFHQQAGAQGIAVRSQDGSAVAWTGKLPSYFEAAGEWPPRGVDLRGSTAYYWVEANVWIEPAKAAGTEAAYCVSVFRAIDARYPGILPGEFAGSLAERLERRVGHRVAVELGSTAQAEAPAASTAPAAGRSASLVLPDGKGVGRVIVGERSLDEERAVLADQGLFVTSVLLLALLVVASVALGQQLVGRRFSRANALNLSFLVAVAWVVRLCLALLREPLELGRLRAFSPYDYATQIPTGILRSPADLALTAATAVFCIGVVIASRLRAPRASAGAGRSTGQEGWLQLVQGVLAGLLALGTSVAADFVMRTVLLDSSSNPFTISPFDLHATAALMKAGVFLLSGAFLLLGAALVAWQLRAFARFFASRGASGAGTRNAVILAAAITLVLAGAALASRGILVMVPAALGFLAGLGLYAVLERKLVPSFASLVAGFAIAAALFQFPYGLNDLYAKQRETVEVAAARATARTDAWEVSVLDQALGQIGTDPGVRAALEQFTATRSSRLDAEALRLWAGSILSNSHLACGVHILGRDDKEIGRFSLEDIGDLGEIEGSIRAARYAAGPSTFITRGTFGGKDTDLYIGMTPFVEGGIYLGSVIISIPYLYNDLESIAGLRPTFFESIGNPVSREVQFGEGYAASLVSADKVIATTTKDLAVGSEVADLGGRAAGWISHKVGRSVRLLYTVPFGRPGEMLVFSYRQLSLSERAVYLMSVILANLVIGLLVLILLGAAKGARHVFRRIRGFPPSRFRWSFATKLALAFLVIAIVPALILGAASREFLRVRLREVMESKAEESLNLSKLALQRLVEGEATRLARNPILMDELKVEPSILGVLVSNDVSAAVADSAGRLLATFGEAAIPPDLFAAVTKEGRSFDSFSAEDGLVAKSAVPVRNAIFPDRIAGCVFVTRPMDDGLAMRLASDLGRDITFYGRDRAAASSKQELFVSEMMPLPMAPDAYVACFLTGHEMHFTWQRVGNADVVLGYSPLREFDGRTTGAISVPLVFRKDAVGQRMEWTSTAISYLVAIVIASIFVFGLLLARKISKPISELIQGTLRVSSGDLGFTLPRASDDEIGDLVSSFNRMTASVERSRNALTERNRYIETIIGNVGAGIISTDWRGRIDTLNSAAEQILGVKARNVKGRKARDVLRRIGAGSLASVLDEVQSSGGVARREVSLQWKDGTLATVRAVASRVTGPRSRMMGKVIVFEDVTELIRSKKLIAWSEMARQVAHEIKNPLTPMKLSAQQVLQAHKDRAGDFDKILEESVATIIDEIESLRRIAVEFSQFSRMPERKLEPTDINAVIEESLGQYERTVGDRIRITKNLDPSLRPLQVDRDEVKRVFLNVIENAVQAMPDAGTLEVYSARRVGPGGKPQPGRSPERGASAGNGTRAQARSGYDTSVTSRASYLDRLASYVEVSFTDSGIGISAENSRKLFEPNFSTKTQGTGLGLAISKGIMDAYGGEIVIESTAGFGTSVKIRFPSEERLTRPRHPRRTGNRRRSRPPQG